MRKNIIAFMMAAAMTFGATSCENFVIGVTELDPTLPTDAGLDLVVNAAQVTFIAFAEGDLARMAGIFTGQFAGSDRQYVSYNNYVVTALDFDSQWANIYSNVIKSFRIAEAKATVLNNKRALGMSQILEAYTLGMTTALFGDVPYTQAIDIVKYPNPEYESQASLYQKALVLLDQGIANISSDVAAGVKTTYAGNIFGGDDAAWIARANTIKAKLLLHLKQYPQAATAAAAGISSPDDEILAHHGASYLQNFNIYYSFLAYDRPGYMTADGALAPALLDSEGDEYRGNSKTDETGRFLWYYQPGGVNAAVENYDINTFSIADGWEVAEDGSEDGFFAADASFPLVTYAENQLILAEALIRGNNPTAAIDALNGWRQVLSGGYRISAAWQAEGLQYDDYDLTDFAPLTGEENSDGIAVNDAIYREILEEKYISLLGTLEVFNDARRTGFGSFASQQNWQVIGITPNTGTQIPQRFLIPQTELNSNTSAPPSPPTLFEKTAVFQ
jgi:hypothetical protein